MTHKRTTNNQKVCNTILLSYFVEGETIINIKKKQQQQNFNW